MLIDPCELSPSYVRSIAPYQPGKPISELAREMGLDEAGIVKLASNENPRGIGPRTRAAIDAALPDIARYPDGNGFELKQALAARYHVDMPAIVLGNGSNDVLELVAAAFLGPGRAAVMSQHAFAVYPLATQARGARSIVAPAKNYGHDLDAMVRAVDDETYVIWVANPNNPTGTFARPDEVEAFLDPTVRRLMPDPHTVTAMEQAAERLADAMLRGELERFGGTRGVEAAAQPNEGVVANCVLQGRRRPAGRRTRRHRRARGCHSRTVTGRVGAGPPPPRRRGSRERTR